MKISVWLAHNYIVSISNDNDDLLVTISNDNYDLCVSDRAERNHGDRAGSAGGHAPLQARQGRRRHQVGPAH